MKQFGVAAIFTIISQSHRIQRKHRQILSTAHKALSFCAAAGSPLEHILLASYKFDMAESVGNDEGGSKLCRNFVYTNLKFTNNVRAWSSPFLPPIHHPGVPKVMRWRVCTFNRNTYAPCANASHKPSQNAYTTNTLVHIMTLKCAHTHAQTHIPRQYSIQTASLYYERHRNGTQYENPYIFHGR